MRARSRGRALRSARRARIRSRSPTWRSRGCRSATMGCSAAMASCRCCRTCRSRIGICSQRFSMRLPIAVTLASNTAARVFSWPPARFCVSSRLRRVAASMMMPSCWRSMVMARMWGSMVRWVSLAYCNRQPAARSASGACSTPKPLKSRVPNCSVSCWRAVSSSNSHIGRRRRPRRCSISAMAANSSG